jgi:hypothetical protein
MYKELIMLDKSDSIKKEDNFSLSFKSQSDVISKPKESLFSTNEGKSGILLFI